jgi:MHS family proline/betaine transporter-like MFS transporter
LKPHAAARETASVRARVAAAGIVGNILEWYDFALYGYLATIFAGQFFPSSDPLTSLIGAYAVFAIGFLARPLGGLIYGHIGDRYGRRRLLTLSVVLMGVPTFLLGLLPTYASVGVLAPVLLVALRFIQGISTGGEFVGSIVFLVEHAPPKRRAFFGSLANFGSLIGGLLGAAVAWLMTALLPSAELYDWGWRLPFLSGIIVAGAGLWIRLGVDESPLYREMHDKGAIEDWPIRTALHDHPKEIAATAGLNWLPSVGYYMVFVWLTADLSKVVGLNLSTALGIGTLGLLLATLVTPAIGALTDRIGPRKVLAAAGFTAVLTSIPLLLLAGLGTVPAATAAQLGLALIMAIYLGAMPVVFVSLHSARVRCSSLSIGYNSAVAIAGGTAPLIATTLVSVTGWQAAPGLYLTASAIIGLSLLPFVPRSAAMNRQQPTAPAKAPTSHAR